MFLRDRLEVLKKQLSTLHPSENFLLRPIGESKRSYKHLFHTEPMKSCYFNKIYKVILKRVFSDREDKVV